MVERRLVTSSVLGFFVTTSNRKRADINAVLYVLGSNRTGCIELNYMAESLCLFIVHCTHCNQTVDKTQKDIRSDSYLIKNPLVVSNGDHRSRQTMRNNIYVCASLHGRLTN